MTLSARGGADDPSASAGVRREGRPVSGTASPSLRSWDPRQSSPAQSPRVGSSLGRPDTQLLRPSPARSPRVGPSPASELTSGIPDARAKRLSLSPRSEKEGTPRSARSSRSASRQSAYRKDQLATHVYDPEAQDAKVLRFRSVNDQDNWRQPLQPQVLSEPSLFGVTVDRYFDQAFIMVSEMRKDVEKVFDDPVLLFDIVSWFVNSFLLLVLVVRLSARV